MSFLIFITFFLKRKNALGSKHLLDQFRISRGLANKHMPGVKQINKHFTLPYLQSPANQMTWERLINFGNSRFLRCLINREDYTKPQNQDVGKNEERKGLCNRQNCS